jgi:hypothetical protein
VVFSYFLFAIHLFLLLFIFIFLLAFFFVFKMAYSRDFDYLSFLNGKKEPDYWVQMGEKREYELKLSYLSHNLQPLVIVPRGLGPFIIFDVTKTKTIQHEWSTLQVPLEHKIVLNTEKLADHMFGIISKLETAQENKHQNSNQEKEMAHLFQALLRLKQIKKHVVKHSSSTCVLPFSLGLFQRFIFSSPSLSNTNTLYKSSFKNKDCESYGIFPGNVVTDPTNIYVCGSCEQECLKYYDFDTYPIKQINVENQDVANCIAEYVCGKINKTNAPLPDKNKCSEHKDSVNECVDQYYFIPTDLIFIPIGCDWCEFVGNLRYALNVRNHKQTLTVDLHPFEENSNKLRALVLSINNAIKNNPFWSKYNLRFKTKNSTSKNKLFKLHAVVNDQIVATYSTHNRDTVVNVLMEVFIQYRIDMNIKDLNLNKKKFYSFIPDNFFCELPTCSGQHRTIDGNCSS